MYKLVLGIIVGVYMSRQALCVGGAGGVQLCMWQGREPPAAPLNPARTDKGVKSWGCSCHLPVHAAFDLLDAGGLHDGVQMYV